MSFCLFQQQSLHDMDLSNNDKTVSNTPTDSHYSAMNEHQYYNESQIYEPDEGRDSMLPFLNHPAPHVNHQLHILPKDDHVLEEFQIKNNVLQAQVDDLYRQLEFKTRESLFFKNEYEKMRSQYQKLLQEREEQYRLSTDTFESEPYMTGREFDSPPSLYLPPLETPKFNVSELESTMMNTSK